MNRNITGIISSLMLAASVGGCESSPTTPSTPNHNVIAKPAVFVLNEGQFGKSTASLDAMTLDDAVVHLDLLPHLGDAGNDLEFINGNLYVLLNGSSIIYVVRPDSVEKLDSIAFTNFEGPEKIVQLSATQALVTQSRNPNAAIIDLQSDKVTGSVILGNGSGGAAVLSNRLFIACGPYSGDSVDVVDLSTHSVAKVVQVGEEPTTLYADSARNQIIVYCAGLYPNTPSGIYWIDASTLTVLDSTFFGAADFVQNIILGKAALYAVLGDRVASLDLSTHKELNDSFVKDPVVSYFNGAFDPVADELYLGDPNGFTSTGSVDVFDPATGQKKRSFGAGIAPAHFAFYR